MYGGFGGSEVDLVDLVFVCVYWVDVDDVFLVLCVYVVDYLFGDVE